MADQRVRIYVKGMPQVDRLSFGQRNMMKLGTVAVGSVINRVQAARNSYDTAAKPLSKKYAIRKTQLLSRGGFRRTGRGSGRKNVRDLTLTGDMLRNFRVRTVSQSQASAACSTRKDRIKAASNNNIELWIAHSRRNVRDVVRAGQQILQKDLRPKLWITRR